MVDRAALEMRYTRKGIGGSNPSSSASFSKVWPVSQFPYKLIDLTHALSPAIPTWDGTCGFNHRISFDYDPAVEYKFRTHGITMNEGIGTHMDSPAHCIPGEKTIDQLPLSDLIRPCVVIDVSARGDEKYKVSVADVQQFEKAHGPIPAGSIVMIKTGWARFWDKPTEYHNNYRFPAVDVEAAKLLLSRGMKGLGIDTLSSDRSDEGFPVHKTVLGAGGYLIENAANLDSMPASGGYVLTAPLKIQDGTEAPVRLIGFIKQHAK